MFYRYFFNAVTYFSISHTKKVPKIEAAITTRIGMNPAPNNVNIGPGQAPANAHPNPKIIPPNI